MNLGRGNTVGMDDSISDMSMDTCFRPARRDDEDDFSDESDYEVTEKRRSFRNSDPKTMTSMVVSSSRDLGVFSALQPPPFTNMAGMDESNTSLGFDSPGYMYRKPTMTRNEQKLGSFEERVRQDILTSKELFNQAVERGENSMRNLRKSREFEDLLGAGSIRNLDDKVHDFLVSDSDRGPRVAKETKRNTKEIDWGRVDAKAKQTLKAYDGHEGNLFPEISHHEARKFSKSGNAWLEGRYATTADWKRDATGMTLEVPFFKDKEEKSGQSMYGKDRSVQLTHDKDIAGQPTYKVSKPNKSKTKARTELTMKVIVAAKPLVNDSSDDASPSIQDEYLQTQFSQSEARKEVENRRGFLRNNSLSSFKMNVSRRFKRIPSIKSDDEGPLLVTSPSGRVSPSVDRSVYATEEGQSFPQVDAVQEYNTSSGSLSVLSSRVSVTSNGSFDPNGSGGAGGSLNPSTLEKRTKRRKSRTDKGVTKNERRASFGRPDDGISCVPDRGQSKKERPTKEGRHRTKRRGSRSSFGSSDGTFSILELESAEGGPDYHEQIREATQHTESTFLTSGLRRIKSLESISPPQHHTEPSMLRKEARTVSRYESANGPDSAAKLPSSARKEGKKVLQDRPNGGFSTDDGSLEPRKQGSESLPKSRRKRSDTGDHSAVSTAASVKSRRRSRGNLPADEEYHNSFESLHGSASVEADYKAGSTRARSLHPTASPLPGRETAGADPDSSLKSSSKNSREHRRRNEKEVGSKRRHRRDDKHIEESDLDASKGTTNDMGTRSERRSSENASESGGHHPRQMLSPEGKYENGMTSNNDGIENLYQVDLRRPFQNDESKDEEKNDLRRRRSSSVPRSTAKLKSINPEENRARGTGDIARENRTKRRSSSVERGAEKAFLESRRGSKERSPSRHAISHRRRSSSLPRRAETSAPSTDPSINQFGDDNESRPSKASIEHPNSYASSVPRRGRSMGVASQSQEQSDNHDPACTQDAGLLQAPRTPRRRWSVERPLSTPAEEDSSRPRRRRSLNPDVDDVTPGGAEERPRRRRSLNTTGDVVTPGGAEERPTSPGRKKSESHQYGQSSNGEKKRVTTTPASSGASKPSFLSRIGARFEAETIKPLEKRNMRKQRAQQLKLLVNDSSNSATKNSTRQGGLDVDTC